MKILTLGSLNIDFVYSVPHIDLEGETISARSLEQKQGGKGLNQAVALARAGAEVFMAGCVGPDGDGLVETLRLAGADVRHVRRLEDCRSGHAIIQLADSGANAIVIYGGANERVTPEMIDGVLQDFAPGDYILLQNEISSLDYAIRAAKDRGMRVALNPSPISEALLRCPLDMADVFILNELEGQALSGAPAGTDNAGVLQALTARFPHAAIVLTLGEKGAMYADGACRLERPAHRVPVVDTTGAGDTFCGYFLACTLRGDAPAQALETAGRASALAIGKKGAAVSIPTMAEVEAANL